MVAKAKQDRFIQMTVDDKWLDEYAERAKQWGGTVEELEPVTDQADLTDIVEQQDEDAAKQKERDRRLNEALGRGVVKGQKDKERARAAAKRDQAKEQALHKRAQKLDAASAEREAKEQEREAAVQRKEAEREEDEQRARSIRDVRHVTRGINQALQQNVQPAIERAGTLPTVGGIGLMVGILLLLLIVIIPVNAQGDTRAKQFWYMLNGRAKLQGAVTPVAGSQTFGQNFDPTKPYPSPPDGSNFGGQPLPNTSTNGAFRTTPTNLGF